MFDLSLLRTFLAVYRSPTITEAAAHLALSQPAVSLQLKTLERQFKQPLFTRQVRGVAPTAAAHELARTIAPHIDALDAIVETTGDDSAPLRGTVHLGGPAEFLSAMALPALASLPEHGIRLRVKVGQATELLDLLVAGELDLAIATQRQARRGVEFELLYEEDFVLVAAPQFVAALDVDALRATRARALEGLPFLAYSEELPIIRRYFRTVFDTKAAFSAAVIVADLRALLTMAVAGAGLTILPHYLCREAIAKGELTVLLPEEASPTNLIFLASRSATANHPRNSHVRRLLQASVHGHQV
jgi:DNA-binding transcriptional LysR family regulator